MYRAKGKHPKRLKGLRAKLGEDSSETPPAFSERGTRAKTDSVVMNADRYVKENKHIFIPFHKRL